MTIARIVLETCLVLSLTIPALAHDGLEDQQTESLRGLSGMYVQVENVQPEAELSGLRKSDIQTDVELLLRQTGIRVLSLEEYLKTPERPYLSITVFSNETPGRRHAFHIRVELNQKVLLFAAGHERAIHAVTWQSKGVTGCIPDAMFPQLRPEILDRVREFINAYLAVNQR